MEDMNKKYAGFLMFLIRRTYYYVTHLVLLRCRSSRGNDKKLAKQLEPSITLRPRV